MYQYLWDEETGGLLLTTEISKFSKEPRPVYYRELNLLGFDQYWDYPQDDSAPIMWAEANNYIYRGRVVAKTKGGSYYQKPEIVIVEEPEPDHAPLRAVDIAGMIQKNAALMETLAQETIQKVYNTYVKYKDKIDVFYVAFSGGKDSVVALDIVQRALPHEDFLVLFGDTRMEFSDTYDVISRISQFCKEKNICFHEARSKYLPTDTWKCFGPPSTAIRWCCSIHKTSPQIITLREITGKYNFTGMAFTGIRADESLSRSSYDEINDGRKHSGQMSFHPILEWSSAELYIYIYSRSLILNEAYKKGIVRAGCLVCPNSTGKHEFIKRHWYRSEVDKFLDMIISTSGKTTYSQEELHEFVDNGFWRTRKSGRELNFGHDKFETINTEKHPVFIVNEVEFVWQDWGKTIGNITEIENDLFTIVFNGKSYEIRITPKSKCTEIELLNCGNSKDDIKFQSLMRSVIIKSLYCIGCGECEAECKFNCIDMKNGISISDDCKHCFRCHDVREHCLRYASVKNRVLEAKKMAGIDRYFTFGVRDEWLDSFFQHECGKSFWETDGDQKVPNKKKDAFKNFAEDAGLTVYDRKSEGDKYTKNVPTNFAKAIMNLGGYESVTWALILCNLVYTPAYNWFVMNLKPRVSYTPDSLNLLLSDVMENDTKGKGKRNVIDALKIMMAKTPLGYEKIFADCDITVKTSGRESVTLNSLMRCSWENADPRVILYALYKFAEHCGDYYQFTLTTLLDDSIERDGISPTRIFGLDRDTMEPMLNGLSSNYPDFISASFSLGLDTINLREDKTSQDVLALF